VASDAVKTPTTTAVSMPSANTQYSYTFPQNTKRILFNLRNYQSGDTAYYSWQTGQVAGPTGNYSTLYPSAQRNMEGIQFDNGYTLYFSSTGANETLEIEYWI
jgi:hypothetical protein